MRSAISWKTTFARGTTSIRSSSPPASGRRRKLIVGLPPSIFHRPPGTRPRRPGSTASTPGHHSGNRWGSASTAHTSSTVAGRTRLAAYRGKELLSAEHALELRLPLRLAELLDPGVRRIARHLLHPEVPIGERGDLRQVRDGHDLGMLGETP